jgi:hypothetical protein
MKLDQVAMDVYELEQHYKIGGQTEVPNRMPGKDYCFDEAQINSYEASVKPGGDMQKLYFLRCAAWPPGEPYQVERFASSAYSFAGPLSSPAALPVRSFVAAGDSVLPAGTRGRNSPISVNTCLRCSEK